MPGGTTPIFSDAGNPLLGSNAGAAVVGELIGLNGNGATTANAQNMNTNGNLGNTNYSLTDIVKALKKAGTLPQ
jgi:hypothetical protein